MNRHKRKTLLNLTTAVAVAATALVVFLPAAQAAPGTVTSNVNVRSGPGTNFAVVDTARRGQQVDVQQCQGTWCYVNTRGAAGWVSAQYLSANGTPVNPSQPGISFGFNLGPDGPNVNIGIGNQQPQVQPPRPPIAQPQPPRPPIAQPQPPRPPMWGGNQRPPRPPVVAPKPVAEVCFFERSRYRGESFCLESGDSVRDLREWTDRISSVENRFGVSVQVCSETNYRNCRTYTTSTGDLNDFDDFIASIRVR